MPNHDNPIKNKQTKEKLTSTYAGEFEPTFCNLQVGIIKAG